jgi:dolichol-phosphate hexosyltransferase
MHINILRALDLQSNGFELETEITVKLLSSGYNIIELPVTYKGRDIDEGKKIRYRDSIKIASTLIKLWALAVFKRRKWTTSVESV